MLVELGVVRWSIETSAADGQRGALIVDQERLATAQTEIAQRILRIVSTGDWNALDDLYDRYVEHSPLPVALLEQRLYAQGTTHRVFAVRW